MQQNIIESIKYNIDVIDIVNINNKIIKEYNVIIIDGMIINRLNMHKNIDEYFNIIKKGKNKFILLNDIHEQTFGKTLLVEKKTYPSKHPDLGAEYFINFLEKYDIKNISSKVICQELANILKEGQLHISKCFIIPHHIDNTLFRDYGMTKKYDILIYGTISKSYPLRMRLKKLLVTKKIFNVRVINKKENIRDIELSKIINQSWITIATKSSFDYLVMKYFEISASKSVIAGDMPEQGKQIWGDEYINLDNTMDNKQIINKLKKILDKKQLLNRISENMYKKIHRSYSYNSYCNKLLSACQYIEYCRNNCILD